MLFIHLSECNQSSWQIQNRRIDKYGTDSSYDPSFFASFAPPPRALRFSFLKYERKARKESTKKTQRARRKNDNAPLQDPRIDTAAF